MKSTASDALDVAPPPPSQEIEIKTPLTPAIEIVSNDAQAEIPDSIAPQHIFSEDQRFVQRIDKLEALVQQLISSTSDKAKEGLRKNELKEIGKVVHKAVEESIKDALQSKTFADQVMQPYLDYYFII